MPIAIPVTPSTRKVSTSSTLNTRCPGSKWPRWSAGSERPGVNAIRGYPASQRRSIRLKRTELATKRPAARHQTTATRAAATSRP